MARIHFIGKRQSSVVSVAPGVYESGDWDISPGDAERLVGGLLFLHETKKTPSYFGGRIESFRLVNVDRAHSRRVVFRLTASADCKGKGWEGANHGPAHTGGVVE